MCIFSIIIPLYFQIFQPSCSHANRIFLGWDPRELLEDKSYDLGIVILPFRTRDEGIALVNKSRFGCCASIWSESITTANYVSSRLEVLIILVTIFVLKSILQFYFRVNLLQINTIWINSHGVIDPSVPLESQKESKTPLNGISCNFTLLSYI